MHNEDRVIQVALADLGEIRNSISIPRIAGLGATDFHHGLPGLRNRATTSSFAVNLARLVPRLFRRRCSMRREKWIPFHLLAVACCFAAMAAAWRVHGQTATPGVTVFEGARLITGDGGAPIENSAFIVQNDRFTQVGRRGDLQVPAGAARVDLTGKTVMPAKVDLHGHVDTSTMWTAPWPRDTSRARISSTICNVSHYASVRS